MKGSQIIIMVLAAAVLVLSYLFLTEWQLNEKYRRMEGDLTVGEIIEEYHALTSFLGAGNDMQDKFSPVITEETGSPLTPEEAKLKKIKFDRWNFKTINKRRVSPYAFAFGTERMQELLNAIRVANQPYQQEDTAYIVGVRAYLVESFNAEFEDQDGDSWHVDLMFVPVNAEGNDILRASGGYKLEEGDTTQLLLNRSIPCPNDCGVE